MFSEDFFTLGKRLLHNYPQLCNKDEVNDIEECVFRTVIDRAYYGAFLTAREWLENNESFTPTRTGEDHSLVEINLRKSKLSNSKSLSWKLAGLRKERNYASYDINGAHAKYYTPQDVNQILITTNSIIKGLTSSP